MTLQSFSDVFLQMPQENDPPFLRAKLFRAVGCNLAIWYPGRIDMAVGSSILIYKNQGRSFRRAPGTVTMVRSLVSHTVFAVHLDAHFVTADRRQFYRHQADCSEVALSLNDGTRAEVVDLSVNGLAFNAPTSLDRDVIEISLEFGDVTFAGGAVVRDRCCAAGGVRYGYEPLSHEYNLKRGLQRVSTELERSSLRRMAQSVGRA